MTDYSELVKALRGLVNGIWKNCEYTWFSCEEKVFADAAAAIEDLQAEQKKTVTQIFGDEQMEWEGRCKDLMKINNRFRELLDHRNKDVAELQRNVDELTSQLPKRGKWIWIQKANGGQYKGCSVCHAPIPTDSMLDYLDDEDCDFCYSCGAKMEVQE